jgi:hypothetical protein
MFRGAETPKQKSRRFQSAWKFPKISKRNTYGQGSRKSAFLIYFMSLLWRNLVFGIWLGKLELTWWHAAFIGTDMYV